MAIPIFQGKVGSLPDIAPATDASALDLSSYFEGAQAAKYLPSVGSAVAKGITAGVENYQKTKTNEQVLEQNELKLEEQRRTQEADIEKANVEAAAAADKAAREIALRKRQDEFVGILQSGDFTAVKDAYVSGQYADVLAANRNLDAVALNVAAQGMSSEEAALFRRDKLSKELELHIAKQRANLTIKTEAAIDRFIASDLFADVQALADKNGEATLDVLGRVADAPSGLFEWDENGFRANYNIDVPLSQGFYDLYDSKTNRIIARGVDRDTRNAMLSARGAQQFRSRYSEQLTGTPSPVGVVDSVQESKAKKEKELQAQSVGVKTPDAAEAKRRVLNKYGIPNTVNTEQYNKAADKFKKRIPSGSGSVVPLSMLFFGEFPASAVKEEVSQLQLKTPPQLSRHAADTTTVARINADPLLANRPALIKGLAAVESAGNREAVSPTGVRGLMQVTEATAEQYGLDRNVPDQNVAAALAELNAIVSTKQFGASLELSLAAYNAGRGTILDAIRKANSLDWDIVKEQLQYTLSPQKYAEVADYPDRVIGSSLSFIDGGNPSDLAYVSRLRQEGLIL